MRENPPPHGELIKRKLAPLLGEQYVAALSEHFAAFEKRNDSCGRLDTQAAYEAEPEQMPQPPEVTMEVEAEAKAEAAEAVRIPSDEQEQLAVQDMCRRLQLFATTWRCRMWTR